MASEQFFTSVYGEELIPIGNRNTFVTCSTWQGEPLIHIRRYAQTEPKNGEEEGEEEIGLYPTRKGVALNETEFEDLVVRLDTLRRKIEKLRKKKMQKKGGVFKRK